MGNRISLVFKVNDDSCPFLHVLPDGHHISQLLGYLNCILGPLLKKGKEFLLFGDKRQPEQRGSSFAGKTRGSIIIFS